MWPSEPGRTGPGRDFSPAKTGRAAELQRQDFAAPESTFAGGRKSLKNRGEKAVIRGS
jgi:hypothetical protein